MRIKFALWILLISTISCAGPYLRNDDGTKVNLGIHSEFEVILYGEGQSNFSWGLSQPTTFIELQQPVGKIHKDSLMEYIFTFKATAEGMEILRMEYSNGVENIDDYELFISVGTLGTIL